MIHHQFGSKVETGRDRLTVVMEWPKMKVTADWLRSKFEMGRPRWN